MTALDDPVPGGRPGQVGRARRLTVTEDLGGPVGDLRLIPDLDGLVALAGQPGWAWAPVDRITQDGDPHPACTRTRLRRLTSQAAQAGFSLKAAIEIEFALGTQDAPAGEFVPACTGPAYADRPRRRGR